MLSEIKKIMKEEDIILDDFTFWYLKENEKSIVEEEAIQILNEIFELCINKT